MAFRAKMFNDMGSVAKPRRRNIFDEDDSYFNDDDPEPSSSAATVQPPADDDDEEEDPLDAFMAGIDKKVKAEAKEIGKNPPKPRRDDIEDEDELESYLEHVKNKPINEDEPEYDERGYPIRKEDKTGFVDPLPAVDHASIQYLEINKNFYEEHSEIAKLNFQEVRELRKKLGLKVSGFEVPKPCVSFAHFGFDAGSMAIIQKAGYSSPTAIQAQAVPAGLSGRDIIGIAQTGSGKTAAFVWPMMVHIMDQPELDVGDGPIAVVLSPTRELALQINQEAKRFGKPYSLNVVCVYGGGSRWEQTQALKKGCEIMIATPGRCIDLIKSKATNLKRVSYLVLDEADRMFNMGFEVQVRSLVSHIRPDRQTLLFSATFPKRIEKLAREILSDPVRIVVGTVGDVSDDVKQIVTVLRNPIEKWRWLCDRIVQLQSEGSVLIFATRKTSAEELAANLKVHGYQALLLHGDMDQSFRTKVIQDFKKQVARILVATDVAARGLDIPSVRNVINYDVARDIDTHTHRVGRTGRAGVKGTAHTLVLPTDMSFAPDLVRSLEAGGHEVPLQLLELAQRCPRFHRSKRGRGLGYGRGGRGSRGRGGRGSGHTHVGNTGRGGITFGLRRGGRGTGSTSVVSGSKAPYQAMSGANSIPVGGGSTGYTQPPPRPGSYSQPPPPHPSSYSQPPPPRPTSYSQPPPPRPMTSQDKVSQAKAQMATFQPAGKLKTVSDDGSRQRVAPRKKRRWDT